MRREITYYLVLVILVALVLLAAAPAGAQEDSSATLTETEQAHLAIAWHLLTTDGGTAWPGLGASAPPYLVRKGDYEFLVGHPDPPPDFTRMPGLSVAGAPVYRLDGHLTPRPVATSWQVGELWSVAVPVRDDLQALLDDMLGPETVELTDETYVRTLLHEALHAHQLNTLGGPGSLPGFTAGPSSMDWLEAMSDAELDALNAGHAAEGEALVAALEAETDDDARAAVAAFLQLRAEHRTNAAPDLVAYERAIEWTEGPARYVEVALARRAGEIDLATETGYPIAFSPPGETWAGFLDQVADPGAIPGSIRERYAALGAAQAFVLDRLLPGWQDRLLVEGVPVEDLLAEAIAEPGA